MGTPEKRPLTKRWREWLRYRRFLAALMESEPQPVSPEQRARLKRIARAAARQVGNGHE